MFFNYIQALKLYNFRNYIDFELECNNHQSIVITGKNGAGKTNILESLSLLAKGRGMRNVCADDIQNNNVIQNEWFVHYKLYTECNELNSVGFGVINKKRLLKINNKLQSNYNLLHKLVSVTWLMPQLDYILTKSPSERLKLFDRIVYMFDSLYVTNLLKYEKAKLERNKMLKNYPLDNVWLDSIENIMASTGISIAMTRQKALNILQNTIDTYIINPFPKPLLQLQSQIHEFLNHNDLESSIEEYKHHLRYSRKSDVITSRTSFGINNDNFQVIYREKNLPSSKCSTGEQKVLLLSLILASVRAKYHYYQQMPILLLDDIMSHLDEVFRNAILTNLIDIGCQTWITDTNVQNFQDYKKHFMFFNISNNTIVT